MSLIDFVQDELKKARIEALKACSYESICDLLDAQESQLTEKDKELQAIKDRRKGASLNELMKWSVKELAELVIDMMDEENEKVEK